MPAKVNLRVALSLVLSPSLNKDGLPKGVFRRRFFWVSLHMTVRSPTITSLKAWVPLNALLNAFLGVPHMSSCEDVWDLSWLIFSWWVQRGCCRCVSALAVWFSGPVCRSAGPRLRFFESPTLCDSNGTTFGGVPLGRVSHIMWGVALY
jgi:hypothetical protein